MYKELTYFRSCHFILLRDGGLKCEIIFLFGSALSMGPSQILKLCLHLKGLIGPKQDPKSGKRRGDFNQL